MSSKALFKRTPFYPLLIYARYFFSRYIKKAQLSPAKLSKRLKIHPENNGICFFGYYNIYPSNINNDVLFLEVQHEDVRGSIKKSACIMLKKNSGQIVQLAQTRTWNWQQGCMLQWYPGRDDQILFNDYEQGKDQYVSKVINISGELIKTYPIPVNNVSKCGKFALSLNYDRLAKMRPDYGYFNKKDQTLPSDDKDGIWHLDLKTGDYTLILSLETLKNLDNAPTMDGAAHKVNHIDINPDGTRFMFLHRWIGPQGRYMRLITANPDGSDLCVLNGDTMTSHCCWINNKEILSFCQHKGERGYFKFIDRTQNASLFSSEMPKVDGHPSVSPDGEWIVTDSYPGKARMSYLYIYSIRNERLIKLGRFHQPFKYKGEMRIDLHPKWSPDSNSIFLESGHEGSRRLYHISIISRNQS